MLCRKCLIPLVCFIGGSKLWIHAFLPRTDRPLTRPFASPLASTKVGDMSDLDPRAPTVPILTETSTDDDDGYTQMTLVGSNTVETEPVPIPSDMRRLNEFFVQAQHRNLLFPENEATDLSEPTPEQLLKWTEESRLLGGINGNIETPDQRQVIQIKAQLNLPGLQVWSASTIGANLFLPDRKSSLEYPEYQFTLLDSQLTPEGPAPLVWLFNQLTKYRDKTSSFTRVRAMNAGGVDCDKIVFVTEARLQTRIRIPSLALRFLPVNVERFERQGSDAVQKLLEKELEPALQGFRDAYVDWIST